jgi:hypothetical protein
VLGVNPTREQRNRRALRVEDQFSAAQEFNPGDALDFL